MRTDLSFTGSRKQLTAGDLAELEKQLGVILPEDYKAFLLAHNGGVPDKIYVVMGDREFVLNEFLPVAEEEFSLGSYYTNFRKRISAANDRVPVADDAFGNLFCLAVGGKDKGTVYFFDHETERTEDGVPLAPSFTTFLDTLNDDPDE